MSANDPKRTSVAPPYLPLPRNHLKIRPYYFFDRRPIVDCRPAIYFFGSFYFGGAHQPTRWEKAMSIESILRRKGADVTTIGPEASIKSAADWLRAKNIGALVVTSGNAVLGLVSEREIVHAFSRYGEATGSMPVKEIIQYGVTTVSPDESVSRVMTLMTHHRVRHIPVLRDGRLAGIISIGDVVKQRLDDLELETNVLRDAYNAAR